MLAAIYVSHRASAVMSYVDPDGVPPVVGAARVGAELRNARERLGWSLQDLAASLRIRLPYLEAIEEGRLSALPGNAYAMGFVRTYANALGLDPDEVTRRFKAEAKDVNRKTELSFPAPVPQRGVPAGAVVLLGLVVAAAAYAGWYRYSGSDHAPLTQTASSPPERLSAMANPPLPAPSPQVASILPSSPPAAAQPQTPSVPVPMPVPVAIAPPAPVAAPPPITTRLVLHAKAGGWVQIREKQGQVLLNRVMRPGETWPVPMKPQLLLTTSNAGAMELLVDGVPAPAIGAPGAMRRDVPLDIDLVKAGRTSPPPAPPPAVVVSPSSAAPADTHPPT